MQDGHGLERFQSGNSLRMEFLLDERADTLAVDAWDKPSAK
jgi:hypothetical protein